ncbi:hypothetical protein GXP67_12545 [Rhodocytophaga rosea]|uniref:Uncharacterized protein n=1 Tax=Rhodocytophaga rosea TaxID=2704465 RepID=A0A6C0GI82_9BACT|nr:hypothetical protein [Rhodocytophaga rosea]QHT67403.1 hypothetical protein GXP67_12545 [Rhodocytophaga rosea]
MSSIRMVVILILFVLEGTIAFSQTLTVNQIQNFQYKDKSVVIDWLLKHGYKEGDKVLKGHAKEYIDEAYLYGSEKLQSTAYFNRELLDIVYLGYTASGILRLFHITYTNDNDAQIFDNISKQLSESGFKKFVEYDMNGSSASFDYVKGEKYFQIIYHYNRGYTLASYDKKIHDLHKWVDKNVGTK